eukprot:TRINITY_DN11153_c0_g1_i1.p1 TRINITY_DN11153_c0_g1~~TRINITY_DN11153_c0_g1_i1.p1  ORF type:complete len:155 (-),score=64.26 TRINITY_DN11153_c0_g1_i1:17-481(-)
MLFYFFFFFSSRRRHTRCREVSWARRCVQETAPPPSPELQKLIDAKNEKEFLLKKLEYIKELLEQQADPESPLAKAILEILQAPKHILVSSEGKVISQPVSYTHLTLPTILLVQISVVAVSLKKKKKVKSYTGVKIYNNKIHVRKTLLCQSTQQ